jgi:hypothetical protein
MAFWANAGKKGLGLFSCSLLPLGIELPGNSIAMRCGVELPGALGCPVEKLHGRGDKKRDRIAVP